MTPVSKIAPEQARFLRAAVLDERRETFKERRHFFTLGAVLTTPLALLVGHFTDGGLVSLAIVFLSGYGAWLVQKEKG